MAGQPNLRMSGIDVAQRPKNLPMPGQILDLRAGEVQYRTAPLILAVERVREDISLWYDGEWVWLEGHEIHPDGYAMVWVQALVAVAAINRNARDTSAPSRFTGPGPTAQ